MPSDSAQRDQNHGGVLLNLMAELLQWRPLFCLVYVAAVIYGLVSVWQSGDPDLIQFAFAGLGAVLISQACFLAAIYCRSGPQPWIRVSGQVVSTLLVAPILGGAALFSVQSLVEMAAISTWLEGSLPALDAFETIGVMALLTLVATIVAGIFIFLRSRHMPEPQASQGMIVTAMLLTALCLSLTGAVELSLWDERVSPFEADPSKRQEDMFVGVRGTTIALPLSLFAFAWTWGIGLFWLRPPTRIPLDPDRLILPTDGGKRVASARQMTLVMLSLAAFAWLESNSQSSRFLTLSEARRAYSKLLVSRELEQQVPLLANAAPQSRQRIHLLYGLPDVTNSKLVGIQRARIRRVHRDYIADALPPYFFVQVRPAQGRRWVSRVALPDANTFLEAQHDLIRIGQGLGLEIEQGTPEDLIFHRITGQLNKQQQLFPHVSVSLRVSTAIVFACIACVVLLLLVRERVNSALDSFDGGYAEPWLIYDATTFSARVLASMWLLSLWLSPTLACLSVVRMVTIENRMTAASEPVAAMLTTGCMLACLVASFVIGASTVDHILTLKHRRIEFEESLRDQMSGGEQEGEP